MDRTRCEMRVEGRSPEESARRLARMRNDAKEIARTSKAVDDGLGLEFHPFPREMPHAMSPRAA
ncbi:hypothetical protein [Streptomyces sp. GS7]|uniref:hypothetical protein n=1 Tax=Streptomyces sp. GS7 TaxID=2692234 RepID=UPI001318815F|nr:hypothetical protein [Streptomyces sp. GS7]QHC22767.1 hypothetical protein GR130_16330 [Streptomyces sp. GS7]